MYPITPEIVAAAITRHFLWYPIGHRSKFRRIATGRNDKKCEKCKQMDYPLRRRFKMAPERLEQIMTEEIAKIEEEKRELENDCEFEKGGKSYKRLEELAEDAIHDWIKTQTVVGVSRTRRTNTDYKYDHKYRPFT
jgi:hypothetical protein